MREKPWFRKQTNAWYIQIGAKQERLCDGPKNKETEAEAVRVWHERMAAKEPEPPAADPTFPEVADLFLEQSLKANEPETYQWHRSFLQRFVRHLGGVRVSALKPFHVTRFLEMQRTWGDSTRRSCTNIIQTCLNWAEEEGHIETHGLKKLKKPQQREREGSLTPEVLDRILLAVRRADPFWELCFAMKHTGARPSEIARVTAADFVEPGVWVLKKHKTAKKTGKPRFVFLDAEMLQLTRRLIQENPEGPLFRNSKGNPWRRNAIGHRFRKLAEELDLPGLCAYLFRHSFCTNALVNGVDVAHVATLMGHTSTDMVMKVYSKLFGQVDHMRTVAGQAAGN